MNRLLYLSIIIFTLLLLSVNQGVAIIDLDENIRLWVQNLWNENLNSWVIAVTDFGADISVLGSLIYVVLFSIWKKQSLYIRFYLSGLIGSMLLFGVLKELVGRSRPDSMLVLEHAKSFPSGHATIATVLAWFFFLVFASKIAPALRRVFVLICFLYPLIMSFTRVYLNVHYLSDVIAGVALGTSWMILLSKFYVDNETQIQTA